MRITVVLYKFLSETVKHIKMFYFKPSKINLNIVLKTIISSIYSCILIKLVYCIFVKDIIVSGFDVYAIVKEDF